MNIISTEGDMNLNSDSIDSSKRSVWEICKRKIIHEVRQVHYISISFTQRARKITYQYLLYAHPYPPLPKPLSLSNLSHPSVTCCDTPEPLRKLSEILNLVFKSGEGWWWGACGGFGDHAVIHIHVLLCTEMCRARTDIHVSQLTLIGSDGKLEFKKKRICFGFRNAISYMKEKGIWPSIQTTQSYYHHAKPSNIIFMLLHFA